MPLTTRVSQELFLVNRRNQGNGFDFDDDAIFDDPIRPKSGIHAQVFIDRRDCLLLDDAEVPPTQFMCQDGMIDGFEQAWTECRVNSEGSIDYFLSNGILVHTGHPDLSPSRKDAKSARLIPPVAGQMILVNATVGRVAPEIVVEANGEVALDAAYALALYIGAPG
jgi:hypothetical protein